MAHETALLIVNTLQQHLATLVRGVVTALAHRKVSPMEGVMLGMQGMNLATYALTVMQASEPGTLQDVLWVLEYGQWTTPPGV